MQKKEMKEKDSSKKPNIFLRIILGILVFLGALFIIIMLIPDDEESTAEETVIEEEQREETEEEAEAEIEEGEKEEKEDEKEEGEKEDREKDDDDRVEAVSAGTDAASATIMVYMNGSDLESESGEATGDISEMLASGAGDNVNVVIQTMGTKKWQDYGISSKTAQTYIVKDKKLKLVRDNLGQLDCTKKDTLSEFVNYCKTDYPADRYFFLFWDHGGGPVYGFGYDEWQNEDSSLTIAEMAEAFSENKDIHFDIIGMDCCIMANMETCYALAPFCKYTLLSEDFESGLGWSYTDWMKKLEKDPGISSPLLGKYIVDSIINANENEEYGDSSCVALFNESTIKSLFSAWQKYAYLNETALLENNYSKKHDAKKAGRSGKKGFWEYWGFDLSSVTLSDYYISDMLALIESIDSESDEAKSLMSALKACVAYYGHTSDSNELTGIAVSLPYGDREFYSRLKEVYSSLDFGDEYVDWLEKFVDSSGKDDYFDFGPFAAGWNGWGDYEADYGCSNGSCANSWFYSSGSSEACSNGCYDYGDVSSNDDWIYDYEDEIWYLYEDGTLYFYDDESDLTYYYDEVNDTLYAYDEESDDWCEAE